jgi:hypothetical protein
MTEERQMVVELVLKGELPAHYVTMEELDEVNEILFELISAKFSPYKTFKVMQ